MLALAAIALVPACGKEETVAAIPASEYVTPETSPAPPAESTRATAAVSLSDVTQAAGLDFMHVTGAFGEKWMPETMGGGAAFFDYDGDGDPDILLITGREWPGRETRAAQPTPRLFRNHGDGTFEDVTASSGLKKVSLYGMGAAIADYDGDGDADIYITAVGKNALLRNDDGRFTDVTDDAGVGFSTGAGRTSPWEWSTGALWVDNDRDGDLDLFVANYVQWTPETDIWTTLDGKTKTYATPEKYAGATCVLFRNDGAGRFTDATREAGVFTPRGKSMAVVSDDFNDDGWADLVVTNDTQPNFLYLNRRDGTFENVALSVGVAYDENGLARAGMGVSVASVAGDARRSIAIGNFSGEPVSLYTQVGHEAFVDRAGATRLSKPTTTMLTFGVLFVDVNLDGFEDLVLANGHIEPDIARIREGWTFAQRAQLFLSDGDGRFMEQAGGPAPAFTEGVVGRALCAADIDGDGDLDLLLGASGQSPRLLRNDLNNPSRSVRVHLIAAGGNRDAIGTRLSAEMAGHTQTRFITTGGSYLSQSELVATFGLGSAVAIDRLTLRWPDGTEESFENLTGGTRVDIQQGAGIVRTVPLAAR